MYSTTRLALLAPDGDRRADQTGFLHELLGLREVRRQAVRARTRRVTGETLGQEVARRLQEPARQTLQSSAVDSVVDCLARLQVVERRLRRVQEEVVRRGRLDRLEAVAGLALDLLQQRRRNRVAPVEDVALVVEDLLSLGLRVRADLHVDRVGVPCRDVSRRLEVAGSSSACSRGSPRRRRTCTRRHRPAGCSGAASSACPSGRGPRTAARGCCRTRRRRPRA